MNGWQAIIFDLDGLLVESESVWHVAETELIESRGHRYTDEVREEIVGMRMDEFLDRLHEVYNFQESIGELYAALTRRMMELIPEKVHPKPGAQAVIDYVSTHNIPRAIASSSPIAVIDLIVESRGWDEVFTLRCSADDDPNGKPSPDVYLRTAKLMGIDPTRCLALEDSPNGARAALAAGMKCFAVPDPSHTSKAAFAGITEHVFDDLFGVLDALRVWDS